MRSFLGLKLRFSFAFAAATLAFGSAAVFAASCDGARDGFDPVGDEGAPPTSFPETSPGDADNKAPGCHCSGDLHAVLDCENHLLRTCPPDQGCAPGGGCVPACESARANKSSIGCDYFSVDTDITLARAGSCFAAFVSNTWTSPVKISVDRDGTSFDLSSAARIPKGSGQNITYDPLPGGMLPAGEVAIVFLAYSAKNDAGGGINAPVACPGGVKPLLTTFDAAVHGTGFGKAFHIATSAPTVVNDILPYGGGDATITGATLLLPTSAWDTNYIAVNAYRPSTLDSEFQPSLDIVAAENDTTVTISPTAAIVGGPGVAATPAGVPKTYALARGQVLQITQPTEITGSAIQSNKPIGVWGGASCLNIDVDKYACDSAHQQLPPVKALGHEYAAVRYRNRFDGKEESPPWRVVGAVDGTLLKYVPAAPPNAPATLAKGQVAEFRGAGPFVIASQGDAFPFYLSAHMTGADEVSPTPAPGSLATDYRGDPEFVNVVPPQQFLSSYVFFTDPTYPETNLVVVRTKAGGVFADVSLDCAGVLSGWQAFGEYEFTRIDLVRHDFAKQGGCDNGRHEMKSAAPFGLTVWGWGSAESKSVFTQNVSYAYPAGASIQPINAVVVTPSPR